MSECFVYIAAVIHNRHFQAPVKIGISANPWSRVYEMQTGCPWKIDVFCTFRVIDRPCALHFERYFHSSYSNKRIHGEWFDVHPLSAVQFIVNSFDAALANQHKTDLPLFLHRHRKWVGLTEAEGLLYR